MSRFIQLRLDVFKFQVPPPASDSNFLASRPLVAVMLQVLYKLKTAKVFERARAKEEKPSTDIVEEDPFAIQTLSWCPESRMLCVAGVSAHVIVYRFSKQEVTTEVVQVRY